MSLISRMRRTLHQLDWPWQPPRYTPGPTARIVLDRPPDRYWLCWNAEEGGQPYHPWVYWERHYPGHIRRWQYIGHLYVMWEEQYPELVELCDIVLFAEYRQQGVGSAVLQALIKLAEEAGMRGIFGTMIPTDGVDPARLAAWYQRTGFTLDGPYGNRLRLRLPR